MSIWSYVNAMISVTLDKSFESIETGNEYIKKLLSFAPIIEGSEGKAMYYGFLEDGFNSIEYNRDEGLLKRIRYQNRAIIIVKGRLRDVDDDYTQRCYDDFFKFLKYNCYIDDEYLQIFDDFHEYLPLKKSDEFIKSYNNIYEYLKQTSSSHIVDYYHIGIQQQLPVIQECLHLIAAEFALRGVGLCVQFCMAIE